MLLGCEVPKKVFFIDLKLIDPTVPSSDSEDTSFEHEKLFSLNADTFSFEHRTFIFLLVETVIKRVNVSLEEVDSIIFLTSYK